MTTAHDLIALNEYTSHEAPEADKIAELVESMRTNGWQGAPILTNGVLALTGTHRIAAAREAGITPETLDLSEVVPNAAEVYAAVQADNEYADSIEVAAAIFRAALGEDRCEDLGLDLDDAGLWIEDGLI